jgi:glycosyltransferase involved in cell wall biosynthesis
MADWPPETDDEQLPPITRPYLLCLNVRSYLDARRVRYLDLLWLKDLQQHTRYLKNLTVACPCERGEPPPGAVAWNPPAAGIRFIDLLSPKGLFGAIAQFPWTALQIWKAIGRSEIVHLGVAGWPIPFGWFAWPMAVIRRKPYVIVVESAPWRLAPGLPVTWKARVREWISETLSRWCVNHAGLIILTQEGYRKTLLTRASHRGHIVQASWLDYENILAPAEAVQSWSSKKLSSSGTLKLLFAGRLERSKGVMLLLDAIRLLVREELPVEVDILGEGKLGDECKQASDTWGAGKIKVLGTIPYDSGFFDLLRRYHAVVVPNLSDEQPRIVYDAYSQAVPILASDTLGLRECVQHGKTGLMSQGDDPADWAALFKWCLDHPDELKKMGETGLETARKMTHAAMHRKRWRLLLKLPGGAAGT